MLFIRNIKYIYENPSPREGVLLENIIGYNYSTSYDSNTILIKSDLDLFSGADRTSNGYIPLRFSGIDEPDATSYDYREEHQNLNNRATEFLDRIIKDSDGMKIDLRTKDNEELDYSHFGYPVGIIYLKKSGRWINLNRTMLVNSFAEPKYINKMNLTNTEKENWHMDYYAGLIDNYDYNENPQDSRDDYLGAFDPTKEVRIGDVQLPIPPQKISVTTINQAAEEPSEILRNPTTLVGSSGHNMRQIRMPFYIKGKEQINGTLKKAIDKNGDPIEIVTNLDSLINGEDNVDPQTKTTSYYINGLRSLLAQFKIAPFLPVDNYMLNHEEDISALTFQNVTVTNVADYPEVLKVEVSFLEFNHKAYIDTEFPFKEVFNWDLFRFYYQRLLEGTGFDYSGSNKFPIIESIDNEHFSMDIVTRDSLERVEQARQFLQNHVTRDLGEDGIEYETDGIRSTVYDKEQFKEANQLLGYWKELVNDKLGGFDRLNEYLNKARKENASALPQEIREVLNEYENKAGSRFNDRIDVHFDPIVDPLRAIGNGYDISKQGLFNIKLYNETNIKYIRNVINNKPVSNEHNPANHMELNDNNYKPGSDMTMSAETFKRVSSNIIDKGIHNEDRIEEAERYVQKGAKLYDYRTVDFDDIHVQNVGVSISHEINAMNINMQNRPAHQYLGTKNAQINIEFITNSSTDSQKLTAIVEHEKELTLRYADIVDTPLLKINNSIVNMFNFDGVFLDDVHKETIEGFPNAKVISMSFIGYYKPDKDLESLSRLHNTEATNFSRGQGEMNRGARQTDLDALFTVEDKMSEINLYPDLALPRYNELPLNFYDYFDVDYNDTSYVDPDFYALNIERMFVDEAIKTIYGDNIDSESDTTADLYASHTSGEHMSAEINISGHMNAVQEEAFNIGDDTTEEVIQGQRSEEQWSNEWPSVYFTEDEFRTASNKAWDNSNAWDNYREEYGMTNKLRNLLKGLDLLREAIGKPITITSALRSEEYNREVDGAADSQHLDSNFSAVDINASGYTPRELSKVIEHLGLFTGRGIYNNHAHVDTRNGLKSSNISRWTHSDLDNYSSELSNVDLKLQDDYSSDINEIRDNAKDINYNISEESKDVYNKINFRSRHIAHGSRHTSEDIRNAIREMGIAPNSNKDELDSLLTARTINNWNQEYYHPETRPADNNSGYNDYFHGDTSILDRHQVVINSQAERFEIPEINADNPVEFFHIPDQAFNQLIHHKKQEGNSEKWLKRSYYFGPRIGAYTAFVQDIFSQIFPVMTEFDNIEQIASEYGILDYLKFQPLRNALTGNLEEAAAQVSSYIIAMILAEGITLQDIAESHQNYRQFMNDIISVYDNYGLPSVLSTDEWHDMINHLTAIANIIIYENENIDFNDLSNLQKATGSSYIRLRDKHSRYRDSFSDMIEYDQRGRLLRAFPTYYLLLIDEGREMLVWKLQDLFYEYSGIESINVVRSKGNVADACHIQLSNRNDTLTDATGGYKETDVDLNFFSWLRSMMPFSEYNLEQLIRSKDFRSIQLQTGARIHLRMGYGSNPNALPVMFNGRITELELGKKIQLVAQNDGIELNRPIPDVGPKEDTGGSLYKEYGNSIKDASKIVSELFDYSGGIMSSVMRFIAQSVDSESIPAFLTDNPSDIRNLGANAIPPWWDSPHIDQRHRIDESHRYFGIEAQNEIFSYYTDTNARNFESTQNIYSASALPGENEDVYFSMFLFGKTPWEVIQTSAMVTPNFCSYVHPFGVDRNTLFFGHPNFDLAYDYTKEEDGHVSEEIKTFRQMHIYGSFYDIISNDIVASDDIVTSVVPIGADNEGETREMSPVYLDIDIKPEFQKQINVDTSINVGGRISQGVNAVVPFGKDHSRKAGELFAASTLAQHVRNMYQGNLTVMGDPTAKPYDYSYLYDMEEKMNGMFEINTVVHTMSKQEGFVTSIEPDPIAIENYGMKEDTEFLLWATSRVNNVYRSFFTARAIGAAIAGSNSIFAKANMVHGATSLATGLAKKLGGTTLEWARKLDSLVLDTGKILKSYKGGMINPTGWEILRAKTVGANLIEKRKWAHKGIKYIYNTTSNLGQTGANMKQAAALSTGKKATLQKILGSSMQFVGKTLPSVVTGAVGMNIKLALAYASVKILGEWFRNLRSRRQSVSLMLLSKNGYEFSAGIDGHSGAVLGNDPDTVTEFLNNDFFNVIFGADENAQSREQLSETIGMQEEAYHAAAREQMQGSYKSTYAYNYETLGFTEFQNYYTNEYKSYFNRQSNHNNEIYNIDDRSITEIDRSDRRKYIDEFDGLMSYKNREGQPPEKENGLLKPLYNFSKYIMEEYEEAGVTLEKENLTSNSSHNPLYYHGGAVSFKTDDPDILKDIADTAIESNIASIEIGNDFIHVDVGPEYFSSENYNVQKNDLNNSRIFGRGDILTTGFDKITHDINIGSQGGF